uniref:Uncharacterized protein n=1 Tax=Ananas comosus var. bracteatus TaxID=296719 RepID=A0A6V7PXC9_ANACO|nr:unnamed protein product [Ananas comosus var. bracteatus]
MEDIMDLKRSEGEYLAPKPPNCRFWSAGYRYQREVSKPRRVTERRALGFELCEAEYRYCIARVPVLEPGTGTSSHGYRYPAVCLLDRGSDRRLVGILARANEEDSRGIRHDDSGLGADDHACLLLCSFAHACEGRSPQASTSEIANATQVRPCGIGRRNGMPWGRLISRSHPLRERLGIATTELPLAR